MSDLLLRNSIGFVVPTKSRPLLYKRLVDSVEQTKSKDGDYSELWAVIDSEELPQYEEVMQGKLNSLITPGSPELQEKLNYGAKFMFDYKYIGTFSDDVVVHTQDFDELIIDWFDQHPETQIIYCNDMYVKDQLATHWVVRREVYEALGFFALPVLKHMFVDNFWTKLGKDSETIYYFPDIIWEHRHFANHKAELDDTYKLSNTQEIMNADEKAYDRFIYSDEYQKLVNLLKGLKNGNK